MIDNDPSRLEAIEINRAKIQAYFNRLILPEIVGTYENDDDEIEGKN